MSNTGVDLCDFLSVYTHVYIYIYIYVMCVYCFCKKIERIRRLLSNRTLRNELPSVYGLHSQGDVLNQGSFLAFRTYSRSQKVGTWL